MTENRPVSGLERLAEQWRQEDEARQREKSRRVEERRRMEAAANRADRQTAVGCLIAVPLLLLLGWWGLSAGWEWLNASAREGDRSIAAASPSPSTPPEWYLDQGASYGSDTTLWVDMEKSVKVELLDGVNASDVHSARLDDLSDGEWLDASDVAVEVLDGPKHGSLKLNPVQRTAVYTPLAGFTGDDEVTVSVKLDGRPEVVEVTHSIEVGLSPGGRYRLTHKYENCAEARAAGDAPVRQGEPGYGQHLDADGDGIGCDWG
jgi:hypothetical protein